MNPINFNTSSSQAGFLPQNGLEADNSTSTPENIASSSENPMQQRKANALVRLDQIDAIIAGQDNPFATLRAQFVCHKDLAQFDLDTLLANYQTDEHPSALFAYNDWAEIHNDPSDWESFEIERLAIEARGGHNFLEDSVWQRFDTANTRQGSDQERRQNFEILRLQFFRNAINQYSNENQHILQFKTVKEHFQYILAYFNKQRAQIIPGTPAEATLKNHFRNFHKMIINANTNCSDQVLSQLQTFIIDMLAQDNASQGSLSLQQKLFNQACLVLCKYRGDLLKQILAQQNPNEAHMADLERFTMEKLANRIGFQGKIFTAGAQFAWVVQNREMKAELAINAFLTQYKPQEYLLEGLGKFIWGDDRSASHTALMKWAIEHYDLYNETPEAGVIEPRISSFHPDNFSVTEGGGVTPAATALLMEEAGLITPRPLPPVPLHAASSELIPPQMILTSHAERMRNLITARDLTTALNDETPSQPNVIDNTLVSGHLNAQIENPNQPASAPQPPLVRRSLIVPPFVQRAPNVAIEPSSSSIQGAIHNVASALSSFIERGANLINQISSTSSGPSSSMSRNDLDALEAFMRCRVHAILGIVDLSEENAQVAHGSTLYHQEIEQSAQNILDPRSNLFQNEVERLTQRLAPRSSPQERQDFLPYVAEDLVPAMYRQETIRFTALPINQITAVSIREKINQLVQTFMAPGMDPAIARERALRDLCEALMVSGRPWTENGRDWAGEAEALVTDEAIHQEVAYVLASLWHEYQSRIARLADLLDPRDFRHNGVGEEEIFADVRDAQGNLLDFNDLNSAQLGEFFKSGLVKAVRAQEGYTIEGRSANIAGNPNRVLIAGANGAQEEVDGQLRVVIGQANVDAQGAPIANQVLVDGNVMNGEVIVYPQGHAQAGQPNLDEHGRTLVRLFDRVIVWGTQHKLTDATNKWNEAIRALRLGNNLTGEEFSALIANHRAPLENAFRANSDAVQSINNLRAEIDTLHQAIPQFRNALDENAVRMAVEGRREERANFLRAFVAPMELERQEAVNAVCQWVEPII